MKKEQTRSAEKILQDIGKSIDELIARARGQKGEMRSEFKERIDELKRNRDSLERDLKKFREEHAQDFEKFESSLQKVADEVKETLQKLFKKEPEKDKGEGG
jgi:phosphoglycolate phosphatase-like HAD superfamily hydrolase